MWVNTKEAKDKRSVPKKMLEKNLRTIVCESYLQKMVDCLHQRAAKFIVSYHT